MGATEGVSEGPVRLHTATPPMRIRRCYSGLRKCWRFRSPAVPYGLIPSARLPRVEAFGSSPCILRAHTMLYEPNPKHKSDPTPGVHGSLCPQDVDPQALLQQSQQYGRKRYATDGEWAFCAMCHDAERDRWHGYPVGWAEVPPTLRAQWVQDGKVATRIVRRGKRRRT